MQVYYANSCHEGSMLRTYTVTSHITREALLSHSDIKHISIWWNSVDCVEDVYVVKQTLHNFTDLLWEIPDVGWKCGTRKETGLYGIVCSAVLRRMHCSVNYGNASSHVKYINLQNS